MPIFPVLKDSPFRDNESPQTSPNNSTNTSPLEERRSISSSSTKRFPKLIDIFNSARLEHEAIERNRARSSSRSRRSQGVPDKLQARSLPTTKNEKLEKELKPKIPHSSSEEDLKLQATTNKKAIPLDASECWFEGQLSTTEYRPDDFLLTSEDDLIKNADIAAAVYEGCRQSKKHNLLRTLMAFMSKVELHTHATSGALYIQTLIALAVKYNVYFNIETMRFCKEKGNGCISSDLLSTSEYKKVFDKIIEESSMIGCPTHSKMSAEHYFNSFNIVESLTPFLPRYELLLSVIRYSILTNELYKELMLEMHPHEATPKEFSEIFNRSEVFNEKEEWENLFAYWHNAYGCLEKSNWLDQFCTIHKKLFDEDLDKIQKELLNDKALKEFHNRIAQYPLTDLRSKICIKFLPEIMRDQTNDQFFSRVAAVMHFCKNHPNIVVGFNIVGPEHNAQAKKNYRTQLRIISFLQTIYPKVKFALHAGELSLATTEPEYMLDYLRHSIDVHPTRISHFHCIMLENFPAKILKSIKKANIALEFCFSSSKYICGNDGNHPYYLCDASKIPVTFNSDNIGVGNSTLTDELTLVARNWNVTYLQMKQAQYNAIEYSLLDSPSRSFLKRRLVKKIHQFEKMVASQTQKGVPIYLQNMRKKESEAKEFNLLSALNQNH